MKCCLLRTLQGRRRRRQPIGFNQKDQLNYSKIFCLLLVIGELMTPMVVNTLLTNETNGATNEDADVNANGGPRIPEDGDADRIRLPEEPENISVVENATKLLEEQKNYREVEIATELPEKPEGDNVKDDESSDELDDETDYDKRIEGKLIMDIIDLCTKVTNCGQKYNNVNATEFTEDMFTNLKAKLVDADKLYYKIIKTISLENVRLDDSVHNELLGNIKANIDMLNNQIKNIKSKDDYQPIVLKEMILPIDFIRKKDSFWKSLLKSDQTKWTGLIGGGIATGIFGYKIIDHFDGEEWFEGLFSGKKNENEDKKNKESHQKNGMHNKEKGDETNWLKIWILVIGAIVVSVVIYLVVSVNSNKNPKPNPILSNLTATTTATSETNQTNIDVDKAETATPIPDIDKKVKSKKSRKGKRKSGKRGPSSNRRKSSKIDMANSRHSSVVSGYQSSGPISKAM